MKSSEILSNNQTISLTESKKDYCDACDSVITKRPHVCPGTEKLSEVSRDPQEVDAADKAISKIVDQKENVDDYTPEEIAQLQKLSKITGRSHKLWNSRNYFRRPVGKIIDRIVMYAREKQRDSGQLPEFTGRASTASDMAQQIAVQTNGYFYKSRGATWTSGRTGRRYRDASDFIRYSDKAAYDDALTWVKSKGRQVHYRDSLNILQTAIQIGRYIVEPSSVTRNAFGDKPETEYRLSVRSAKSLEGPSRKREDITDQQAAALRDIARTKNANAVEGLRMLANLFKGEKDIENIIKQSQKVDPRDKAKLDKIIAGAKNFRDIQEDYSKSLSENLRDWFGKGKEGGAGGGGWDRYNTKGERIGKCGDSKPGEGKPKCLSKSKAASLRAKGGKKAIANAVKRKKSQDKNPNRRGKAKNVKNVAESNMSGYETVDIWTSNFTAHGQDMRYMFDLPDNSTVTFGELPYTVQVEIERQIGGQVGDGEQLIIKQHPARGLDHDRVTVLVPELEELDESVIYSDRTPNKSGLSYYEMNRVCAVPVNYDQFAKKIVENFNIGSDTNLLEVYGYYLRKLNQSKIDIRENKTDRDSDNNLSKIEQNLFKIFKERSRDSISDARVGDIVSLLHLATIDIPGHRIEARLSGFLNPKKIVAIKNLGRFNQLEFQDGSKYPENSQDDLFQTVQSWNMTRLFRNSESASKAYMFYALVGNKLSDEINFVITVDSTVTEETMAQASKNPTGPKFGGYYGATQKGPPKPGQSFGGAAESTTNHNKPITEVAPPDQEDWIKKNKERFIKQYGKKKGTEVLYATAWKRSKSNEAANWGPHEGHVSKNPVGIPENQESDLEKKLERAKQRLNAYTTKAPLRDKVKTRKEISDLKKQLGKKD